jgi:hypothetical protein
VAELTTVQEARASALASLVDRADAGRLSEALLAASDKALGVIAEHDSRPTAQAWRAYAAAQKATARLVAWKEAVRQAEPDGRRNLESAHLLATEALSAIDVTEPVLTEIAIVLNAIAAVAAPAEVEPCLDQLRGVPLPLPISKPPRAPMVPHVERAESPPEPIAVALFELSGEPAPDAALIHAQRFNDVRLQLRLTQWPEWADELHATAVSVAGENASFPSFRLDRPQASDADGLWTVEGDGKLVIKAVQPLGDDPLTFTLLTELVSSGDGRKEAVRTVGQRELRLWAIDDSPTSFFTGYEQLDERLAKIFALISHNDSFGPDAERKAFMRFLRGLLRAATVMQTRRVYRGATPDERRFQTDLLNMLDQQDALHGRVQEGSEIAGGETDLVHDKIVAELKVVKNTAVTAENVGQFLGQTTSYSSGLGSQLGIAVILDLSEKKNPLGHPANYVHWVEPKLHGVTDPTYASHVAVLVVNGNAPLPSDFAGSRVEAVDALDGAETNTTPPNGESG